MTDEPPAKRPASAKPAVSATSSAEAELDSMFASLEPRDTGSDAAKRRKKKSKSKSKSAKRRKDAKEKGAKEIG